VPELGILLPVRILAVRVTLVGALAFLLMLATVTVVARRLAAPLRQLTAAAGKVETEDYRAVQLDDIGERSDELGQLARGFQRMVGEVDARQQRLRQAVLSELGRLHTILDGGAVAPDPGPREAYAVEPVLAGLVTLRRSAGVPVALVAEPGLRACGDAAVLAQVVTNLLANCDRHAPGAPVVVRGYGHADRVVVEVRDEGPGLPVTLGHDLLRRGVHDSAGGGSGLGLHISARLVDREGGELDLRTATKPLGCLATVRLPAAGAQDRPGAGRSGAAPTR